MKVQVIAHRGASGLRPENTAAAVELAHQQGADWIECDVVLTRDGEVLVSHDVELDLLTDVAVRYPDRARADGRFYVIDFTLEEIRFLRSGERRDLATGRSACVGRFAVAPEPQPLLTLEEWVELVQQLNAAAGRDAGLCVELKQPVYHQRLGCDLAAKAAAILERQGYNTPEARCMVLSFEPAALQRLRLEMGWQGPLLQLIGPPEWGEGECDYARLTTPAGLTEIATYAQWIATHLPQVVTLEPGVPPRATGLVASAHACGLRVGAYTFQPEGLPDGHNLAGLLDFAAGPLGLDAVISDFPADAVAAVQRGVRGD
ncbi:MAG: glycerophosphodiester phosphodiesterase [Cephaloticoccus sp.]|nr:glycerophosphodiester phosphodiesterase [Cephaloticoccus sp.]MCF7759031.1 glycerophosphodiester phosphodiesterase [Cephaloticoccus sp.]